MSDDIQIDPLAAAATLSRLRWDADSCVVNHFGDRVWLRPFIVDGERVGITECCFADEPCDRHAKMAVPVGAS